MRKKRKVEEMQDEAEFDVAEEGQVIGRKLSGKMELGRW